MARLFTFLLALSVLWCGLELCAPAVAHDRGPPAAASGEPADDHDGPSDALHAGHHHCPLATELGETRPMPTRHASERLHPPARVRPLASRRDPPPAEPPAA